MEIRCLIIDDEPLAIQVIASYLKQIPELKLIASFQNPLEAFELLKEAEIDLVFLDIQMPLLTGIDFVKLMQNPPKVIFTTAYRNYAIESYELDVVDYLLKPISFTRFFKAINKYKNQLTLPKLQSLPQQDASPSSHIYVNSHKKYIKVPFEEILYIESLKDYIRIHTEDNRIMTKEKIGAFEQKLPQEFLRVHRSFIVNTQKLTAFTAVDVEIGDQEIPIGASYKQEVLAFLKNS